MQAQEKMTYHLNGETIEFNISKEEMYVEFVDYQKSAVQRISKDGFEELSNNSAILKMSEFTGTFNKRQQSLRSKTSQNFQRIEPVLIYNDGTKQIAKGELNIKLKANASLDDLLIGKTFSVQPNEFDKDLYLVKLNLETSELFELVNQLQKDNRIEFVEPNFIRMIKPHTNDPFFSSQWAINNQGYLGGTVDADMDVDDAWNYTTGEGIKVAIIDTGVDLNHPDLQGNLLTGYDATGGSSSGNQTGNAHGTACAGIVAAKANNNKGTAGVAYNAKIIPIRIFVGVSTNDNWVASGINWAWQNGADVLSNSYGGGSYSSTIESAINNAVNNGRNGKGSVVLFSSGNDNGSVSFPSTVGNAISVGASSMCDERKTPTSCDGESWWGSNFGNSLDIVAPGVKIYTTDISGSAGYNSGNYKSDFNGTSSACPNAAGVVALILSADPSLTQQEAREILERNTDKVNGYNYSNNSNQPNGTWNNEVGYGRINALRAVEEVILGNIQLTGTNTICNSNTFYSLSQVPNSVTINWSVSSNLQIVNSSITGATVKAINSTAQGNGFVRATIGTRVITKNVWVGKPSAVTGLHHVSTFGCTKGEINVDSGGGADQYEWIISGGTIVIPSVNSNSYTGQSVIFVDPIDGPYGFTVKVRAKNSCGYSAWYTKHIPTRCSTGGGGGGGVTPLSNSFVLDDKTVLFPNPASETAYINLNQLTDNQKEFDFHIKLFDFNGSLVFEKQTNRIFEQINVSSLRNGIYILHLSNGERNITEKLVIQH
jgi:subtilisin family serine protease